MTLAQEEHKLIVFEKGNLLFVFNFHHSKSYEDYEVGTSWASDHIILYNSDDERFGGHNRLAPAKSVKFTYHNKPVCNRRYHLKLYLPNRTAIVLLPFQFYDQKKHA